MLTVELPKNLEEKYHKIDLKFRSISDDWKKYNDEIIPEDKKFAIEIVDFIIHLIAHIDKNYNRLDLKEWNGFLYGYHFNFYYGPDGNNDNYLDFDEANILSIFPEDMNEFDKIPTKQKLKSIKKKFIEARTEF